MPQYSNDIPIAIPGIVSLGKTLLASSTAIDNTVNQFDVIDIQVQFQLGASGVSPTGVVRIGILASDDGGVTYDSNIQPNNLYEEITTLMNNGQVFITRITVPNVPQFWKLAVRNLTGTAFDTNIANFNAFYCGVVSPASSSLLTNQINVVSVSTTLLASANSLTNGLVVTNMGSDTVYLGPISVTTLTGLPLVANATIQLENFKGDALYGIVPSTTSPVAIMYW